MGNAARMPGESVKMEGATMDGPCAVDGGGGGGDVGLPSSMATLYSAFASVMARIENV